MLGLIDADILAYQASWAYQKDIYWNTDEKSHMALVDPDEAFNKMLRLVVRIKQHIKAEDIWCVYSEKNCFRYDFYSEYKSNRDKQKRPVLLDTLKLRLKDRFESFSIERLEADDVLGILATKYENRAVICTIDKDLLQIPGKNYNWRTKELTTISPAEGFYWHYYQTLVGDFGDGYPGCPRIGPKKAERMLQPIMPVEKHQLTKDQHKECWEVIVKAYEAAGQTEERALQMARVAKILQKENYDEDEKKIRLWEPTR